MSTTRFTLRGALELKPLVQGSLSRLCGLYSVLNAVQLALYPKRLSRPQLQDLYYHGLAHLSSRRRLSRVMGSGMIEDVWLPLAGAITGHANDTAGSSLVVKQILGGAAAKRLPLALDTIRQTLLSGSPVLTGVGGALDHYTVIAGYTEKRLLLFDSSGLRWIGLTGVGLEHGRPVRHFLYATSVSAVVDDWLLAFKVNEPGPLP